MGNNPIRYVDPDGRIGKSIYEVALVYDVLGERGLNIYLYTTFVKLPKNSDRSASWDIFSGIIFLQPEIFDDPLCTNSSANAFIHEIFHQIQYDEKPLSPVFPGAFSVLIQECLMNSYGGYDTYEYGDLSQYEKLDDFPYLEAQAQMVGDFAELYYRTRYKKDNVGSWKMREMKQMAEILKESGYNTRAVQWVLEHVDQE